MTGETDAFLLSGKDIMGVSEDIIWHFSTAQ